MSKKITILEVPISVFTQKEGISQFIKLAKSNKKTFAATPNAEILLESQKNKALRQYLQKCELNFPDSVSLLWAAEFYEKKWSKWRAFFELLFLPIRKKHWSILPEKITGSDSFELICAESEKEKLPIALIGGRKGVAKKTAEILQKKFPKLQIIKAIDGLPFLDFWKLEILEKLEGAKIIFVALGCPRQELWIAENLKKIASARIALGIGGTFDFYSGNLTRSPIWMQKLGLEWLYRLAKEPKRWKRILNAVFIFPKETLKNKRLLPSRFKKI